MTAAKLRTLTRLLDASSAPVWVIGPSGTLVYLSVGVAEWLGLDAATLLGRRCVAGSAISDDPLDRTAASLSPPVGLSTRGTASLRVQPPARDEHRPVILETRFVRIGSGDAALIIGIGGPFNDRVPDPELADSVAIRQRLDAWRRRQQSIATIATVGRSLPSRYLRRRLQVAVSTRVDVAFLGPEGCQSEAIASLVHQQSAAQEPLVTVDGQLMDAELLDAILMPLIHRLSDSTEARGTALVRRLDRMPIDAQSRLVELYQIYEGRLRLLALCEANPKTLRDQSDGDLAILDSLGIDESHPRGIEASLLEILSALSVSVPALANRVEDIPLIATALVDARRSDGEGTVERLSRRAIDVLVIYPWPGDVDELDAAIRHAIRTATGETIGTEHLPLAIRSFRPGDPQLPKRKAVSLDDAVTRYEQRLIEEAIETAEGNRAEAARRLGISRSRLLRKMEDAEKESRRSKKKNSHD